MAVDVREPDGGLLPLRNLPTVPGNLPGEARGGPPGIGALLVRDLASLEPVGGQEKGYRRGTQDAPAAAAFAAALECGTFAARQTQSPFG